MADNKLLRKLKKIHGSVFAKFEYKTDLEQFNSIERWVMPPDAFNGKTKITGDCEDFALACRKLCREQNIKSRLVVCITEQGEGHCVLECSGYILDNRYNSVKTNTQLKYDWLYISDFEKGGEWRKINND